MTATAIDLLYNDLSENWFRRLGSVKRVAWDIETSGLDWRDGHIGTCQLHAPELGTVIVQLKSITKPARLAALIADSRVRKVFHHAPFDLRWIVTHWGVCPRSIDCTKIASRILDQRADSAFHSLKYLLDHYLDVEIDKGQRLTNWLADNLTNDQLAYAAADVSYLLPLLDHLTEELGNADLLGLYGRCAEFLPTVVRLQVGGWPDVFAY